MYLPKHFQVTDKAALHSLMDKFSFAALVTNHDGRLLATHLPFMIRPERGDHGVLVAHMARANEQWHDLERGEEALVIFQGHHSYISPSWYETYPNVPTWNYMVVHAYGRARIVSDEDQVIAILRDLVARNEEQFDEPWMMDVPDRYVRGLTRGIVAFEIPISRLEGKFKLNQNHPDGNRKRAAAELARSLHPDLRELGAIMASMESHPAVL